MLNIECKQCYKKWHHDNAKYCSMCGKKLVDEPEFKVGDYAVELDKYITKIEKINEDGMPVGYFYELENNGFCQSETAVFGFRARHATPEEIAEYEAALTFHKHGREPFEVKKGDLIRIPSKEITFILNPENFTKEEFLDYRWEFLKTVEEVNDWVGADDE